MLLMHALFASAAPSGAWSGVLAPTTATSVTCRPLTPNATIFIGTNHKTGTVLAMDLFAAIAKASPSVRYSHCNDSVAMSTETCIATELAKAAYSLIQHDHVHVPPSMWAALRADALSKGKQMYMVDFLRDPLNVTLSGYYYHLAGSESWCTRAPSPVVASLSEACGIDVSHGEEAYASSSGGVPAARFPEEALGLPGALSGIPAPSPEACSAIAAALAHSTQSTANANVSYTELLERLPPKAGVMVEAFRVLASGELKALNDTSRVDQDQGSSTVDLDAAATDCQGSFTRAFGVAFAGVDDCVRIACALLEAGSSDSHGQAHRDASGAEEALLRSTLLMSQWWQDEVEPLRRSMAMNTGNHYHGRASRRRRRAA
jgi:hypothetical protein